MLRRENTEFFLTPGGTLRFKQLRHKYEKCIKNGPTEDKSVLT